MVFYCDIYVSAVVTTLEGFYETSLALDVDKLRESSSEINEVLKATLELVLAAVVQCEQKEKFVKEILTMEDSVQADLMAIIERVMATGAAAVVENSTAATENDTAEREKDAKESPGFGSPLYLSRNAVIERTKRENGVLKEENVQAQLARERHVLALVRADLEAAQGTLHETKSLNAQLQKSAGQLLSNSSAENEPCSAPTLVGGISEFNPELMEKLTRLEFENSNLKKQVNSETVERIDSLLDEIGDLSRLKKSFETKYFETHEALESTQVELRRMTESLLSARDEHQGRMERLTEWQLCLQEDLSACAAEKQIIAAERDRLSTELDQSVDREYRMSQGFAMQEREFTRVREVNREQRECLSMVKEDLEGKHQTAMQDLTVQFQQEMERTAMHAEDLRAGQLRFQKQKDCELDEVCRHYNEQLANTICQMTTVVDAKSAEIRELNFNFKKDKLEYIVEIKKLEKAHRSARNQLERYQELYTVFSTEKEKLNERVKELEQQCMQCNQQEQTLKSTIKSQLLSNARLVEKNKGMKADILEKRATITKLESVTTRLESKVAMLEKERVHLLAQEKRKKTVESGMSTFSSQLSTQTSLVVTELEKVLKENKELNLKVARCRCSQDQGELSDSNQKAKNYYSSRIQQLEQDKQQVEHKRRELLLVNAKLIQEQKQLHVSNVRLTNQLHDLEESLNHWRLRGERRRKTENSRGNYQGLSSFPAPVSAKDTSNEQNGGEVEPQLQEHQSRPSPQREASTDAATHEEKASLGQSHRNGEITPASSKSRKRKLEDGYTTPERNRQPTTANAAGAEFTDANDFSSSNPPAPSAAFSSVPSSSERRSKRRFSRFIKRTLASNTQQPDKPSECQQQ
ncbi:unnamed protein product [Phytophthora lilii]|uniref:Unnamed protein product n=1 Tax=Phytophthora lilii TaxID=2077276 RepID=A0A9W6TFK1_9STRA|nr:unnamed protein product [Phytophthora lilii]